MYEDKDPWPFKCPRCKQEFTEPIGTLKTQAIVRCPGPGCSMRFQMSPDEFSVALDKARSGEYDPFRFTWGRKQNPEAS